MTSARTQQNILFMHTDSMDGRVMGCMGHPSLQGVTPNLDALAGQGTLFRNAYSNNPICCPSRASMLSGQYTHHCEGWNNYKGLEPGDYTFLDALSQAGYRNHIIGKTDHLSGRHTFRARVSAWTRSAGIRKPNYRMHAPRVLDTMEQRVQTGDWERVDGAVAWLREHAGESEQPFFLYVGPNAPHPPFTTSRYYLDRIDPDTVLLPPHDPCTHPALEYQRINKNWMHGLDEESMRLVRRIYFAMIAEVDEMVGQVLGALDACGLAESTTVIFSSDHGELALEHEQFYKMSAYEGSIRIPLIVRGPHAAPGRVCDELVSLVDIHPTLLDLAGCPRPAGLDGYSLLPDLAGATTAHPGWALSEFFDTSSCTSWFMLRRGDWKYIVHAGMAPQLFNLVDDPWEIHDLSAERPDLVHDMDALLRSIVDYDAVDAKVKDYDRASFAQWREERLAAGDYRDLMSRIFSGWDRLDPADIQPWTDEDEAQILAWMNAVPV